MCLKTKQKKSLKLTSFPKTKYDISKLHVCTKSMVYFKASILFFWFGHCFYPLAPTFMK